MHLRLRRQIQLVREKQLSQLFEVHQVLLVESGDLHRQLVRAEQFLFQLVSERLHADLYIHLVDQRARPLLLHH